MIILHTDKACFIFDDREVLEYSFDFSRNEMFGTFLYKNGIKREVTGKECAVLWDILAKMYKDAEEEYALVPREDL
jgi:hypothetical protein